MMPLCISVEKKFAESVIKELRKLGLLDDQYAITRTQSSVIIPVKATTPGEVLDLSYTRVEVTECSPPKRKTVESKVKMPALDFVGNVVILRENVLKHRSIDDVVRSVKQVYPRVRAIWVKEETVDTYRLPVLRLLWGDDTREILVKEHGLKMKVLLGEVYFNPRLAEEHYRVSQLVRDGEIVVDAFSGIGGFALQIALRKVSLVVANDLNPTAYELLVENTLLNKSKLRGIIIPLNTDVVELPNVLRHKSVDRLIADFPTKSTEYFEVYDTLLKPRGVLHLYLLSSRGCEEVRVKVSEIFKRWEVNTCRVVMEYSPRRNIYRCDLVKPKNI